MRNVLQYFDLIAKVIELSPAISPELELDQLDHKRGTVEGTLYFVDGSRLEFTERVIIERARPVKRDYRYQYVRAQSPVFRYDMRHIIHNCRAFRITSTLDVKRCRHPSRRWSKSCRKSAQ